MEINNKLSKAWIWFVIVNCFMLIIMVTAAVLSLLYFLQITSDSNSSLNFSANNLLKGTATTLWLITLLLPPFWWLIAIKLFKKHELNLRQHITKLQTVISSNNLNLKNKLTNPALLSSHSLPIANKILEVNNTVNYIEQLNSLIKQMFMAVIITNQDGQIVIFNQQAAELLSLEQQVTYNFSDFIFNISPIEVEGILLLKATVKLPNSNNVTFNLLQNTLNDSINNISYIMLMLLPEDIAFSSNNYELVNTIKAENVKASKDLSLIQNDLFSNEETILLQDLTENIGIGLMLINEEQEIILTNKEALNLLGINSSIINLLIGEALQNIINNDELNYIYNTNSGKVTLLNNKQQYIELYFIIVGSNKLITLTNISDKKDLEKQITFAQRLQTIGQIASAVAHDFNNLLTAIMSFAYFLRERYTDDDPSTVELEQIQQNANRAKVMIRQLLTFSRGQELNPIAFDVNSEISNLMSTVFRLMGEKIKAEFIRGKNVGKIMMDTVQFHQIMINLIVNARDAMKKGGKLFVTSELIELKNPIEGVITTIPASNYVLVTIQDEGEGIPPENLRKIFQIHFSTKGDKGNGLGLATVAKILQSNAGFVDIKSIINKGTTFYLYLQPDYSNSNQESIATVHNEAVMDLTGNGTIMLVEDEIPVRMVCKRILQSKGYKVLEAEDAEVALSLLQKAENKVDLIISDVMMPGLSGPEFIAKVRKDNPNIKAILMSGYAEDVLDDKDYTLDHVDFLSKPFSPDVLATKVKKAISK